MRLAVDVGNTDIVIGLREDDRWVAIWRKSSKIVERPEHYITWLSLLFMEGNISHQQVSQVVYSSVVPSINDSLLIAFKTMFGKEPIVVAPHVYSAIRIAIDFPYELGTDLFANAVATYNRFQANSVIVDFGTALTFTTITEDGVLQGVAIAPGLKTAMNSLFTNTAQLPEVPLEIPKSPIGKNTVQAIQSGVLLGYEGLVRSMVERIRAEVGGELTAVATGGLSSIISSLEDVFTLVDKNLTLEGLNIIGESAVVKK